MSELSEISRLLQNGCSMALVSAVTNIFEYNLKVSLQKM